MAKNTDALSSNDLRRPTCIGELQPCSTSSVGRWGLTSARFCGLCWSSTAQPNRVTLPVVYVEQFAMAQFNAKNAITETMDDAALGRLDTWDDRVALLVKHAGGVNVALLEPGGLVVIGRMPDTGLTVEDPTLSRNHARFELVEGRVRVTDLGSRNGCWYVGKRVESATLDVGDEIVLGKVIVRVQTIDRRGESLGIDSDERPVGIAAANEAPLPPDENDGEPIAGARMRKVLETIMQIAASRLPIILLGETGTGKEVLAQLIHDRSPRKVKRMVRVNCGAIPRELVESTLFGHERGAFTGAVNQQKGVFEEADGGTVFLDEIGELPPAAQAALLRVLETGSFHRVGSTRELTVDVRVVAATHRSLETMTETGAFRADLYYRLGGAVIDIPPLRERADEIEALARRFLRMANASNHRNAQRISPEALEVLKAYAWPGNVRELRNVIERAVVVAHGTTIDVDDLPPRLRMPKSMAEPPRAAVATPEMPSARAEGTSSATPVRGKIQQYEVNLLRDTLEAVHWNRNEAAARLGIPVRTLSYRMKVLGLQKPST